MRLSRITREFFRTIKSVDRRVLAGCVAVVLLASTFGFITRFYTLAYDVYYNDERIGTVSGKKDALTACEEAGVTDGSIRLVLRIAPSAAIGLSDVKIGILVAATDAERCSSIVIDKETLVSVKDAETAEKIITKYAESFGGKYYEILTDYDIKEDARLPKNIASEDEAEEIIAESGKITVRYEKTVYEYSTLEGDVEYIDDDTLFKGTEVVECEGSDGVMCTAETAIYENDTIVEMAKRTRERTSEPVNKVIRVGTAVGLPKSFDCPTDGVLTSPFGERWGKNHTGVDIGAEIGTPIYAVAAGTVELSGYDDSGYGNRVKLSHGKGWETLYAHMSEIYVSEGDTVAAGQLIGAVGSTGRSTGPHLHFEVIKNGAHQNPQSFTSIKSE